jgi:tripartite-type tricarboxylate transporter receptor subunit TctC
MSSSRRCVVLRLLTAAAALALSCTAAAQGFPGKPITIVVPWPPGAATDAATRIIAEAMGKELGQPVNVENRPGASGAIGSVHVAGGPKDGYRLITATADTHTINPQVRRNLAYDAVKDFEPIALFGTLTIVWVSRPDLPYKTLAEALASGRQRPAPLTFGSWGLGSTAHLAGALLEISSGVDLNHVPFQGAAPAVTALAGSHIDLMPSSRVSAASMRGAGKVKAMGVAGNRRVAGDLADVPTLDEQGIKGAEWGSWYGLMAPRGIPADVRARLTAVVGKVLAMPDVRDRIAATGLDPVAVMGADFQEFLRQQWDATGRVIRAKQISLND